MPREGLPRPARVAGTVFAWVLATVVMLSVVGAAWVGVRGILAYDHLRSVQQTAARAADLLDDPAAASGLVAELAADTTAARELTSDPVWNVAASLPWIGPQLTAVATVAAAADDVATTALSPLIEAASVFSVDSVRPVDGRIDLEPFLATADAAARGADGVARAADAVASIDKAALLTPVRDAIGQVEQILHTAADSTDALARATRLLPAMLGADGPRDYLVVFQNNAEWRSLGGVVGAMAIIHTDDGRLELAAQGSSSDFSRHEPPVVDLDPEVRAIYSTRPARYIQNVTQVPDFSVGGAIAREMWQRETGLPVDGVIAMDPVALSYLLEATGPVQLPTGETLTSENAVEVLLKDAYERYEPTAQDAFFASATAAVFDALAAGDADPAALVAALGRAGDERRLLIWSAVSEDQQVLEDTTLSGPLPVTDADTLGFGVYLNDGTGSKMDYYVDADITAEWTSCAVDVGGGTTGDITLTVTVTNNAPADAATSLPDYVTGGAQFGGSDLPPGTARTLAYVYLPEGALLREAVVSDGGGFGGGFHNGRQVLSYSVDLQPGETATATFTVRTGEPGAAEAVVWVTPTIDADVVPEVVARCDG